jgi:hypothetical protein
VDNFICLKRNDTIKVNNLYEWLNQIRHPILKMFFITGGVAFVCSWLLALATSSPSTLLNLGHTMTWMEDTGTNVMCVRRPSMFHVLVVLFHNQCLKESGSAWFADMKRVLEKCSRSRMEGEDWVLSGVVLLLLVHCVFQVGKKAFNTPKKRKKSGIKSWN